MALHKGGTDHTFILPVITRGRKEATPQTALWQDAIASLRGEECFTQLSEKVEQDPLFYYSSGMQMLHRGDAIGTIFVRNTTPRCCST